MENTQSLLQSIWSIKEKLDKDVEAGGRNFNIFKILKMESDEVKLHSAFIGELLNPKGKHKQGDMFLKLFFEKCLISISDFNTENIKVEIEKKVGKKTNESGGRIDILITDSSGKYVIIENKIYAGDQENQLLRYHNFGNEKIYKLLYLTLYGSKPSEESKGYLIENVDYFCISYKNEILEWLKICVEHLKDKPHPFLKPTIEQYINLVKYLTGQSVNKELKMNIIQQILNEDFVKNIEAFMTLKQVDLKQHLIEEILVKHQLNGIIDNKNTKNKLSEKYGGFYFKGKSEKLVVGFIFDEDNYKDFIYGIRFKDFNIEQTDKNILKSFLKEEFDKCGEKNIETTTNWAYRKKLNAEYGSFDSAQALINIKNGELANHIKSEVKRLFEIIDSINEK